MGLFNSFSESNSEQVKTSLNNEFIDLMNSSTNLNQRFKQFSLEIISILKGLNHEYSVQVISRQLTRSALSSSANYRAACRSKSRRDFINKMKMVEEELDESMHWMELMVDLTQDNQMWGSLLKEANELLSITIKSITTARSRIN